MRGKLIKLGAAPTVVAEACVAGDPEALIPNRGGTLLEIILSGVRTRSKKSPGPKRYRARCEHLRWLTLCWFRRLTYEDPRPEGIYITASRNDAFDPFVVVNACFPSLAIT